MYLLISILQNSSHIWKHQAIKDVSASYDALLELFELIENFLKRLNIYTKVQSTTAMTEIVVKILAELLATLAVATQQVKQGRLSRSILRRCLVLRSVGPGNQ